jgi:hypothetical protein
MRPHPRHKTIASLGTFIVALLTLSCLGACRIPLDKDDANPQAQAKKGPAQISVENGQTVITLDTQTQNRLGLEVAILTATLTKAQVTLPAVVLPVQDLATFRNGYVLAQAQLQKAKVGADVARKEYTRLKTLFEQNHNISEKSLQSAEGTLQTNEADVRAGGAAVEFARICRSARVGRHRSEVGGGKLARASAHFRSARSAGANDHAIRCGGGGTKNYFT